jgi:hypothetical protein
VFPSRPGGAARAGQQQDTLEEPGPAPRRLRVASDASSAGAIPFTAAKESGDLRKFDSRGRPTRPGVRPNTTPVLEAIGNFGDPLPGSEHPCGELLCGELYAARATLAQATGSSRRSVLGGREQPLAESLLFERRTLGVPGRVEARRTFYLGIRTAP